MLKLLLKPLKIIIFLAIAFYLIKSGKIDFSVFRINLQNLPLVVVSLICMIAAFSLGFVRLRILMRAHNFAMPARDFFKVCYTSNYLNLGLAGGMGTMGEDGILCGYLTKYLGRQNFASIASTLFINRCIGLFALVLYTGGSFLLSINIFRENPVFMKVIWGYAILCQVMLTAILFIFARLKYKYFYMLLVGLSAIAIMPLLLLKNTILFISLGACIIVSIVLKPYLSKMSPDTNRITHFIDKFHIYTEHYWLAISAFVISFFVHLLVFLCIYFLCMAIFSELNINLMTVIYAAPPALICNVIPLPANALGVGELVFDKIVNLFSVGILINGVMVFLAYRIIFYCASLTSFFFSFVLGLKSAKQKTA